MTELAHWLPREPAASASETPVPPVWSAPDLSRTVDEDRRAGTERIIELGRWLVIIFTAVTTNFPGSDVPNGAAVNMLLATWAAFNLTATLLLMFHRLPGRRSQYVMTAVDVALATCLVWATGGFASSFGMTFFVVVITSSLRFGLLGSLACAALISVLDLAVELGLHDGLEPGAANVFASRLFLYFVVALASGLLARELVTSRARQLAHTFELEHAAFAELREVDRIKSEFMMLASHELRTPLTKIKAWLALMQDAGDRLPAEARDEGLVELRGEAEHLARLTDNLLCIAQLESGEIRLRTAGVEVDAVVREVVSRFVESADRDRFECTIDPQAEHVLADHERLALVLACLVDNALKFSPDNEPVRISAHSEDAANVLIEVRDNGRRIPDDQVDRVFASFYQVESPLVRQRGGFGIGLYLARQLVERMGGSIWIDNSKGRGNTFIIRLAKHV